MIRGTLVISHQKREERRQGGVNGQKGGEEAKQRNIKTDEDGNLGGSMGENNGESWEN